MFGIVDIEKGRDPLIVAKNHPPENPDFDEDFCLIDRLSMIDDKQSSTRRTGI